MERDRNLLFGVLAVQLLKVTPAQLVDIAGSWATDPSRSLPARMLDAGLISRDDHDFIEGVAERAIRSHGGDAAATIASFGGNDQVYRSFAGSIIRTPDGDVIKSVYHGPDAGEDDGERLDAMEEVPGRYTHISEYSRGGMGRVLLVHDQHLGRDIAMKELLPSCGDNQGDTPQSPVRQAMPLMARFLQEARITGQLEHPAIVPVYELGRRTDGTLYYTMKLVRGETFSHALKACKSLNDRLKLLPHFLDLCQAIAYAHSLGVIHRDIKPANVMVGYFGETVVIDWGLAKAKGRDDIHAKEMEKTMLALHLGKDNDGVHTAYGEAMGTPTYMPPEQAEGKLDIVNERSDVYSLGAVLYEILAGSVPFSGKNVYAILKKVLEEQPAAIHSLEPNAPPELTAICKRAMSKDASQRYATAKELADEIERFLSGALVEGYRYGLLELLGRFMRRHKAILATATSAAMLLLIGGAASYVQVMQERDRAIDASEKETLAREHAEAAQQTLEHRYYQSALLLARNQIDAHIPDIAAKTLAETPEYLRHWEFGYLEACTKEYLRTSITSENILSMVFSPDSKQLLTISWDGIVKNWDIEMGKEVSSINTNQKVDYAKICKNANHVITATNNEDNHLSYALWNVNTGHKAEVHNLGISEYYPGNTICFSPDGKQIVTGGSDNLVRVSDVNTGKELFILKGHKGLIRYTLYSPDGSKIITSSMDGTVKIWDAVTGLSIPVEFITPASSTSELCFYPDSQRILAHAAGGYIMAWDIRSGETLFTVAPQHTELCSIAEISPDGKYFLTVSYDKTANLFDAEKGELLRTLKGHGSLVHTGIFSPDGKIIVTSSEDGENKLWTVQSGREILSISGYSGQEYSTAFSPDGIYLASGNSEKVKIWDLSMRNACVVLAGHFAKVNDACFDTNGNKVFSISYDKTMRIWDAHSGIDNNLSKNMSSFYNGRFLSTNAKYCMMYSVDEAINLLDIVNQTTILSFTLTCGYSQSVAINSDNSLLAFGAEGCNIIKIYDVEKKQMVREIPVDGDGVLCMVFNPNSNKLTTYAYPGIFVTYDIDTGTEVCKKRWNDEGVWYYIVNMTFSPDGQNIVMCTGGNIATIINANTFENLQTLRGHTAAVCHSSYSPDGKRIVTSSNDLTARVWDASTGSELVVLKGHKERVNSARFSADGQKIVTASDDKTCRIWNALPWRTESLPGDDTELLDKRLEKANNTINVRHNEIAITNRTISREILYWAVFQTLQIPEIVNGISDGLDGYLIGDSLTPKPLYYLGIIPGDRILNINDNEVNSGQSFVLELNNFLDLLATEQQNQMSIVYERQGQHVKRVYEIQDTHIEHKEVSQNRALFMIAFELLETIVPNDYQGWVAQNSDYAKRKEEPENAVSLSLEYASDIEMNILNQFGLTVGDRLCSINGVMMNRLDTLYKTLFELKTKMQSGEVNNITIVAQRGEFTRVEVEITLTD